jgi:hypothetical protein
MEATLSCGFDKWKETDDAKIGLDTIPLTTLDIIGKDSLKSGKVSISALTDIVVQSCIKRYGQDTAIINKCAMDTMRPVYISLIRRYGQSSSASDYLSEPSCKGYSKRDIVNLPGTVSLTPTAMATATATPPQPQVKMEDVEKMVQTSIMSHITQLH